ncbi:bifunctional pantoate--beta-alanine ligase/(d)CMP kinase [Cyanobium sp. CH-040]|uniref:bifunctional pantoate--beta-alanine ligase/(d)CMP kinase n=1 Tax=Cyanobium sp. CH-040 TaxID=2823708 RepID=UPI0020CF61A5|nr:bifunctional pantoate--beta-alanine ligase/(d)CMP kinase [Cyanobium sp. CH-040]MCP9929038.1 bifunctional pantoate--beta-alanine ligase/(d)CMP kinase [Cyanobium sp. CH-040]
MQLLRTRSDLLAWRRAQRGPVHFVPTMGALHAGHLSLIRRAAEPRGGGRPVVLVSVYVNPLQFGPQEDFQRYPRDLDADAGLAGGGGAQALFAPAVAEIQPGGEDALTRIQPPAALLRSLCAPGRPGHFEGVATVVVRLLALVRPQRLLLGEKDWQQLVILRRVLADLGLATVVEGCPTVREADGLACSSRNSYLTSGERRQAAVLPAALRAIRASLTREPGADQPSARLDDPATRLRQELEGAGAVVEYAQLVAAHSLAPLTHPRGLCVLAAAIRCGPSRLIDHTFLMSRSPIVAIDGPAGAGKSTVTRALARRLGLLYLDTGAMYRAVTWWVRHQGVDPADAAAVGRCLEGLDLQLVVDRVGEPRVRINGHEVSEAIRGPQVTAQVSQVAAHGCVREALTAQQRSMGQRGGLVAEGRDIGTAVFPDAELKVFLTATVAERARRRASDLEQRGFPVPPLAELEAQIAERDHLDSTREVAPLVQAADAEELVTDGMTIEAVIQALVDLFRQRVPEEAWPDPGPA